MKPDPNDPAGLNDPLTAIESSLATAARRRIVRVRRRRRGVFAATAAAATLAVTGGAFAVTSTTTGVPALDRLIGSHTADAPADGGADAAPPLTVGRPVGDLSPAVDIPLGDGRSLAAAGFETRDGLICGATVDPRDASETPRGGLGCVGIDLLQRELAKRPLRLVGGGGSPIAPDRYAVHFGVARGDVSSVTVGLRGTAPVDATLSRAWRAPSWDGKPLRVFFAVLPAPEPSADGRVEDWYPTEVRARLADGTVVDGSL